MSVSSGIDQLRADPDAISGALYVPFQNVSDTQGTGDLAQIARRGAVLHHRTATGDLQVGDLCQVGENLVLHAIRKENVFRIGA